jgi:hypothetical protein
MQQSKVINLRALLMLTLFICLSFKGTVKNVYLKKNDLNDSIRPFRIEKDINPYTPESELRDIIRNRLINVSGDKISLKDIETVKYYSTYKIKDIGATLIFKVKLSYNLPSVWHYSIALIVDSVKHNGYLIDLDVIEPIKIKQESEFFYFAGRYKDRHRYGTFKIFEFKNSIMHEIFESDNEVSNYSNDCISYENDDLKLQNIDLNNDGYLDLKFFGIKNYYCNGYEQYGREERKPIKSEKVSFIYYFDKSKLNWRK